MMKWCRKKLHRYLSTVKSCPQCAKIWNNNRYRAEPEKYKNYQKQYRQDHVSSLRSYRKKRHSIKQRYDANYRRTKARQMKIRDRIRTHRRYHVDICFRLACILRCRLGKALKQTRKPGSAIRDLGCTVTTLRHYLESLFLPGMSWSNYGNKKGQWSIDHIIPLSSFDLTDREQFLKACHYTNLQPLWHIDNIKKSNHM